MGGKEILLTTTVPALSNPRPRQFVGLVGLILNPDGAGREVVPLDAHAQHEPCVIMSEMSVVPPGIKIPQDRPRKIKASLWKNQPIFVYAPGKVLLASFFSRKLPIRMAVRTLIEH
jgi:hypothetical protein